MSSQITAAQALAEVRFVKWKDAVRAIRYYVGKKMKNLQAVRRDENARAKGIISDIANFNARVGTKLSMSEFKNYVELHKQLRDTVKSIQSNCMEIHDEVELMLGDCMKLVDRKWPMYSKFMKPRQIPEDTGDAVPSTATALAVSVLFLFVCFFVLEPSDVDLVLRYFGVSRSIELWSDQISKLFRMMKFF